ncbi:MAG: alanine:cation symporter family protein [Tepidamorphaceae bacterium]
MIGASASLGPVIDFSDAAIFAMAVVNIIALYLLMPIVKGELNSYLAPEVGRDQEVQVSLTANRA